MSIRVSKERLRAIAERVFPAGARVIEPLGESDLMLLVSWRLGTDPTRPSKRSKTVQVVIAEEAIEDYTEASVGERQRADARLERMLTAQLQELDPDHNAAPDEAPPLVHWVFGAFDLLG